MCVVVVVVGCRFCGGDGWGGGAVFCFIVCCSFVFVVAAAVLMSMLQFAFLPILQIQRKLSMD